MVQSRSLFSRGVNFTLYIVLTLIAVLCVFPILHVAAVSLSDRAAVTANTVALVPVNLNLANYERILSDDQFWRSAGISVVRTVGGTLLNMALIVLTAYPLAQAMGFFGKRVIIWLLIFAMLFEGGLIPLYLAVRNYGLLDRIWALILPGAVNVFYIIVMVSFFRALPQELTDAALIDGASHWGILFRIFIPLSLPALATLTLFVAVEHWNAWFDGLIYMRTPSNYPLQTFLQTTLVSGDYTGLMANSRTVMLVSQQSLRSAQIILTTLPILLLYPFLQRYFVSGLTLGAVKG